MRFEYSGPMPDAGTRFGYHGLGLHLKDLEIWIQTLPLTEWHLGLKELWWDGPITCIGFGFFEVMWHRPF